MDENNEKGWMARKQEDTLTSSGQATKPVIYPLVESANAPKTSSEEEDGYYEAPASVNTRLKSKNGFVYQWTMRDSKNANLFFKIKKMEEKWLSEGFTPVEQQSFSKFPPKVEVPTKPCTIHNVPMKEKIRKTTGEKFYSHSRGVYPNLEWCNGQGFPGEQ